MARFNLILYVAAAPAHPSRPGEGSMSDQDSMDFNSGMAAFEAKHFSRAAQLLSPLAESGNDEAQYRLAIMYQNGLGVTRNEELAVKWMRAAAERGNALAQHGLGFMYLEGDCIAADAAQAAHWFRLAADQGLAGAQVTLSMLYAEGRGVPVDPAESRRWAELAGLDG